MDPNRKRWNAGQQILRKALAHPETHEQAVELFLIQHAMCHTAEMSGAGVYSFEDEIWEGLDDAFSRCAQPKFEHSIVWCFWHLTRIEDVTMNMLLAGTPQLFLRDGWFDRLGIPFRHTGNGMDAAEVSSLSAKINISSLRNYRFAGAFDQAAAYMVAVCFQTRIKHPALVLLKVAQFHATNILCFVVCRMPGPN